MDRFDSMRIKGINTNDATATAGDIAVGKTAYVAGKKITGTSSGGGGSLSSVGTTVTVEAVNNFNAGERFVGVANATPILLSQQLTEETIAAISDDCSVFFYQQAIYNTTTKLKFGLVNEENLVEDIYIDLPAISNVTTISITYQSRCGINEDGTYAVIATIPTSNNTGNGFIFVDIDKENKTGTARFDEYFGGLYSVILDNVEYYDVVPSVSKSTSTPIYVYGKQILTQMNYTAKKMEDDTSTSFTLTTLWNSSAKGVIWYMKSALGGHHNYSSRNGNYINIGKSGSARTWVVDMETGEYVANVLEGQSPQFSRNGKYAMTFSTSTKYIYLYSCTPSGLALIVGKLISALGGSGLAKVDSSGNYFLSSYDSKIYKFSENVAFANFGTTIASKNFEISDGKCCLGNSLKFLSKDTQEYRISNVGTIISTTDRIYGITNKAMTVGETGTAQMLFRN